jgi:two-component system, sensor histidine kinase
MTGRAPGRSILVIDDHPDGARAFCDLLEVLGHTAEVALSGEEGLERIRDLRPEVVFCDWRLPGMGAADVVQTVRADPQIASTLMVCLTAYVDPLIGQKAMAAGFDVHLIKPAEMEELERILRGPEDS